mmetsp:Transcript_60895/g.145139  ORF Transcript_60895/g.145139 Transcript_60895/m.145139 type:complete len:465 (-) Transcript_60895:112-1506(-)
MSELSSSRRWNRSASTPARTNPPDDDVQDLVVIAARDTVAWLNKVDSLVSAKQNHFVMRLQELELECSLPEEQQCLKRQARVRHIASKQLEDIRELLTMVRDTLEQLPPQLQRLAPAQSVRSASSSALASASAFVDSLARLGESACGGDCPVCLSELSPNEDVVALPCGDGLHRFHRQCIKNWASVSACCPLCRQTFNGDHSAVSSDVAAQERSPAASVRGESAVTDPTDEVCEVSASTPPVQQRPVRSQAEDSTLRLPRLPACRSQSETPPRLVSPLAAGPTLSQRHRDCQQVLSARLRPPPMQSRQRPPKPAAGRVWQEPERAAALEAGRSSSSVSRRPPRPTPSELPSGCTAKVGDGQRPCKEIVHRLPSSERRQGSRSASLPRDQSPSLDHRRTSRERAATRSAVSPVPSFALVGREIVCDRSASSTRSASRCREQAPSSQCNLTRTPRSRYAACAAVRP